MTSYEDALSKILEQTRPLAPETVPVHDALGRYLASDLNAAHDSPRFDNSAVDGFAVRSADLASASGSNPVSLRIVGPVYAGTDATALVLNPGETARTMTGAQVANGADAVVMQEDVELQGSHALFSEPPTSGQAVRRKGEEFHAGDLLVPAGAHCTPSVLALVASQGLGEVTVNKAPQVGIVVTGSELVSPGQDLGPGQIYESNSVALAAAARALGADARTTSVPDDLDATRDAFLALSKTSDIVVFSGGASVGEKDLVRCALLECGVKEHFWKVSMKPGKPVFFGTLGERLVFALPGNPVSAQVTFALLVAPAVRAMMGSKDPVTKTEGAVAGAGFRRVPGRKEFLRATTTVQDGRLVATPLKGQGSHMARGVALADRLIVLEPDVAEVRAGTIVDTVPWR